MVMFDGFRILTRIKKHLKFIRCFSNRNILKLHERGFYSELFPSKSADKVVDLLHNADQTVYAGFDPTAESLHIGNLLVIINLLHWQRAGHNVIALIGGATAQIGDPSGKKKDRAEIDRVAIEHNTDKIQNCLQTIFDNHFEYFSSDLTRNINEVK